MKKQKLTAKQIDDYVPETLNDILGNNEFKDYAGTILENPPEEATNLMVIGDPGTGKTSNVLAYLRLALKDPGLGYNDNAGLFSTVAGKIYGFVRINGATVKRDRLQSQADDAMELKSEHTFVLLDEAGELFFQGLEDVVRPMLEHPGVTTYATAQDFHSKKRKTDTEKEHENRLTSFLRRFHANIIETEKPTNEEVAQGLKKYCEAWYIDVEAGAVELLAQKCKGIFSYAKGALMKSVVRGRRLTIDLVRRYNPDPLTM